MRTRNEYMRCMGLRGSVCVTMPNFMTTGSAVGLTVFGQPFVKRFALCYRTIVCLSVLSVTLVYCGQTIGWIKTKLGMQVCLGPGHIVLDGGPSCPPKGAQPPYSVHICCGQMARWIKMPLGKEVGLGLSEIVLDVDTAVLLSLIHI